MLTAKQYLSSGIFWSSPLLSAYFPRKEGEKASRRNVGGKIHFIAVPISTVNQSRRNGTVTAAHLLTPTSIYMPCIYAQRHHTNSTWSHQNIQDTRHTVNACNQGANRIIAHQLEPAMQHRAEHRPAFSRPSHGRET